MLASRIQPERTSLMGTMFGNARSLFGSMRNRMKARRKSAATRRRMPDVEPADLDIIDEVRPYTMVGAERTYGFMQATRYIACHRLPGAIVECGVWKGGAVMASIRVLQAMGVTDREYYLYDTYEGMPQPGVLDQRLNGTSADPDFHRLRISDHSSHWCRAEFEDVRDRVLRTGYDPDRIHFVKGRVERTIPDVMPERIAILRLDTDWYESTKHELEHLFPRLVQGGVLILDDYGHWLGARQAVNEYFAGQAIHMLLQRTDHTGRMGVKI
jgi:hypothetical protein